MRLVSISAALVWVVMVLLLSDCGKMCIGGIGTCDLYNKPLPTPNPNTTYTLTAVPSSTISVTGSATLKLTSNNITLPVGSCTWDIPVGGGSISGDTTPQVFGALCTANFTPSGAGQSTLKVTEKNSGSITQLVMTVTSP